MLRNGIAVDAVEAYEEELRTAPEAGAVTVRTRQHWSNGYAIDWHADAMSLAGHQVPRDHASEADRPRELGGGDRGPGPNELFSAALGACIAHQFVRHAARREIFLEALEVVCESRLDMRGSHEIADVRPGLQGVQVTVYARADRADDDMLEELLKDAVRTSPLRDSLSSPVPVEPSVHRVGADQHTPTQHEVAQ